MISWWVVVAVSAGWLTAFLLSQYNNARLHDIIDMLHAEGEEMEKAEDDSGDDEPDDEAPPTREEMH